MTLSPVRDIPRRATLPRRTEALISSVSKHHRAISAHTQQLLSDIAELDRRKAWRVDGATSMVAWLVQHFGISATTAREWVTAAQRLVELPMIADALGQGKLSFDQIKPLVDVAKPDTDARLAEEATHWSAKQVRELAQASRNKSDEEAVGSYSRRFLRFNDRRRSFSGVLPDEHYALVKGTLFSWVSRKKRSNTTFDQRMADTLVELCDSRVGARGGGGHKSGTAGPGETETETETETRGGTGRIRPTVVVHADLTLLAGGTGHAELDVLGPLSPEVARRLACDARIIVSGDDAEGRSIQQGGARRSPTPAQRREVRRRDKGCRWPGCTYSEFTDVHHVVHWTNNGPTDIPNLVELCDQHHRSVHELGWKMSGDANGELTFRSPTGRVTTSTPSPTFNQARDGPPD
jgi:hypothetical protein